MNNFDPNKHKRRSIRLKGYDYSQAGLYFITICCKGGAHLFGEVVEGEMQLNVFGEIVLEEWMNTPNVRDNIRLHECIVMPNHIHGIVEILFQKGEDIQGSFKSPSQSIGAMVRGYKNATIKRIKVGANINSQDNVGANCNSPVQSVIEIIQSLDYKIWQRNYYDHVIRDEKAYHNISNYIINNPLRWKEDKFNR